ncbi:MAG: hypothetical protein JWR63_1327 [Conexibacter sp.]|nr:hypothetical protein [Conexibacter sp.]
MSFSTTMPHWFGAVEGPVELIAIFGPKGSACICTAEWARRPGRSAGLRGDGALSSDDAASRPARRPRARERAGRPDGCLAE